MMVYLEGDDEEIQRTRRNPILDVLREGEDADPFRLMEDCLARLQSLRLLCDRLE
jgi:hypothetical protein